MRGPHHSQSSCSEPVAHRCRDALRPRLTEGCVLIQVLSSSPLLLSWFLIPSSLVVLSYCSRSLFSHGFHRTGRGTGEGVIGRTGEKPGKERGERKQMYFVFSVLLSLPFSWFSSFFFFLLLLSPSPSYSFFFPLYHIYFFLVPVFLRLSACRKATRCQLHAVLVCIFGRKGRRHCSTRVEFRQRKKWLKLIVIVERRSRAAVVAVHSERAWKKTSA